MLCIHLQSNYISFRCSVPCFLRAKVTKYMYKVAVLAPVVNSFWIILFHWQRRAFNFRSAPEAFVVDIQNNQLKPAVAEQIPR